MVWQCGTCEVTNAHTAEVRKKCHAPWYQVWAKGHRGASRPKSRTRPKKEKDKKDKGKERVVKEAAEDADKDWQVFPQRAPWIPTTPQTRIQGIKDAVQDDEGKLPSVPPPPALPAPPTLSSTSSSALTTEETKLLAHLQGIQKYGMLTEPLLSQLQALEARHQEALNSKALTHAHLNRLHKVRNQTNALTAKIKTVDAEWVAFLQEANGRLAQHAAMYQKHRAELIENLQAKLQELANLKAEVSSASKSLVAAITETPLPETSPEVQQDVEQFQQATAMLRPTDQPWIELTDNEEENENTDEEMVNAAPSGGARRVIAPKAFRASTSPNRVANQNLKQKTVKEHKENAKESTGVKEGQQET